VLFSVRTRILPRTFGCSLLWLCLLLGYQTILGEDYREWTDRDGRTFTGSLKGVAEASVEIVRKNDGQTFTVLREVLSDADQQFVSDWEADQVPGIEVPERLEWPRHLRIGPEYRVEVVERDRAANRYVYRSNHFEFISDIELARAVVRNFGQVFEATLLAVERMPFRWNPQPMEGTYFKVRLFGDFDAYHRAGGMVNSAGQYVYDSREILVALPSVGLRKMSSEYVLEPGASFGVLIHEITHQVHHRWISQLPVWLVEGLAVYMESIPYADGEFRFDRRDLREFIASRSQTKQLVDPAEMMDLSFQSWSQTLQTSVEAARDNYFSAFVLSNFFFHDADGGRALYRYLRAIELGSSEADARRSLLADYPDEALVEALVEAYARQKIRLKAK